MGMLNLGAWLEVIKLRLAAAGIENPGAEAELILMEEFNLSRGQLVAAISGPIPDKKAELLERIMARRLQHEPLQYIFGRAHFMNIWLHVAPGVLIPRPETELLVEKICREAPSGAEICDLGAGCGTIALALAHERSDLRIIGVDISRLALKIAGENLREWKLSNVQLLHSDLFAALTGHRFDYIAANLPYVSPVEYRQLPVEVRDYEPELALQAEDNGLAVIRRAIMEAPEFLKPDGKIIFEIGTAQGPEVKTLLEECGKYRNVAILKDYNGHDRFAAGARAAS